MDAPSLNARVVARDDPSPETAVVRVAADAGPPAPFEPGQFATLGLPGEPFVKRVYSIASAPGEPWLEFYVRLVPFGKFTTVLWPCRPGDPIWLSPKITGAFTLDKVPQGADLVLVATGTGIAPYLSMLRARGKGHPAASRPRRIVLIHGARTPDELGYRSTLEDWGRSLPGFSYVPTLTRAPGWGGREGRVHALFGPGQLGFDLDPSRAHVFLCGNPAMIDEAEQVLGPLGFSKAGTGNLHFERWW